jgi:metal-dependent amidase/aminoacylase/carboxypeptidase family protein
VNALDAVVLAYNAISLLRQQLRSDELVHGIITKGGAKPNIIPDHTAGEFYVRAMDDRRLSALKAKVLACFDGAAKATGCRLEHRWVGRQYSNLTTNDTLADSYIENARAVGIDVPTGEADTASTVPFSTDMGNVSHLVPSIHPLFAIHTQGGNHTREFAEAAGGASAHGAMMTAAKALAMTALDVYGRADLLDAARRGFKASHTTG